MNSNNTALFVEYTLIHISHPNIHSLQFTQRPPTKTEGLAQPEITNEPVSGEVFQDKLVGEDNKLFRLSAVECRCMFNMCFLPQARAYAYGLYLDSHALNLCEGVKDNKEAGQRLIHMNEVEAGSEDFIPASKFEGQKEGYEFKMSGDRLGYFKSANQGGSDDQASLNPSVMLRLVFLHDVSGGGWWLEDSLYLLLIEICIYVVSLTHLH